MHKSSKPLSSKKEYMPSGATLIKSSVADGEAPRIVSESGGVGREPVEKSPPDDFLVSLGIVIGLRPRNDLELEVLLSLGEIFNEGELLWPRAPDKKCELLTSPRYANEVPLFKSNEGRRVSRKDEGPVVKAGLEGAVQSGLCRSRLEFDAGAVLACRSESVGTEDEARRRVSGGTTVVASPATSFLANAPLSLEKVPVFLLDASFMRGGRDG